MKDSALKKFGKYGKYKDLIDINSLEVRVSIIGSILISFLLKGTLEDNSLNQINLLFQSLTKDIAVALIGFLGFTVAGLAILTGVISKKEVEKIVKSNKLQNLEKILLSFYLLGIVTSVVMVGLMCLYILSMSNKEYSVKIVLLLSIVFSYLIIFILFYAVKLIGNSLEIFFIVNSSEVISVKEKENLKVVYNSYRLTALENVCLKKMNQADLADYMNIIKEQITENMLEREELEKLFNEHFNQK